VSRLMQQVHGVAQVVREVSAGPAEMAAAVALGVVTSMIAAWFPAGNAARVDPVRALQKGKHQVLSAGEIRARQHLAAAAAAGALLCLFFSRTLWVFYTGYILATLAALLMAPTLSLWLSHALRPLLAWLRPVEGALAADSLIQAPRRTSATVSALMLSLAMVIGFGGVARSIYNSLLDWVETVLNPDLFVTPNTELANRTYVLPPDVAAGIESLPGVREVQLVRSARVPCHGAPVLVVAAEVSKLAQTVYRRPLAGRREEMGRRTAAGEAVIISDNLAGLRGLRVDDLVELSTPKGLLRLPIAGIVRDYSDQLGTVLLDRSVYQRWWGDDSLNVIRVYLTPGASAAQVKEEILRRSAGRRLRPREQSMGKPELSGAE